jgi:hypothetical protein
MGQISNAYDFGARMYDPRIQFIFLNLLDQNIKRRQYISTAFFVLAVYRS